MNEIILLKLGELVLKGLNRRSFEDKLQANIHRRLHPYGQFRVYTRQSATYVEPKDDSCDVQGAYEALTKVFGIAGLSLARPCEKDKDAILACARDFLDGQLRTARTFKVETKRADKTFPMTSIQVSQYVGGELHEAYDNLEVDVHHPELTVYVEIRDYAAFVHADPERQTAQMLARHAAHMADVMGVEHVACGFDFCEFFGPPDNEGARGLEDCGEIPTFFRCLEDLGMSRREREMIARENFLRVLK